MRAATRIGVVGGGAYGTALANAAAAAGRDVVLWMRDGEAAVRIDATRENAERLPGVRIRDGVRVTADPASLAGADAVLVCVPTQALAPALAGLAPGLPAGVPLVACAKGIERGTGRFPTEILRALCPLNPAAILSGPSFAADLAAGLPTAVVLAAESGAARLAEALSGPTFRVYHGRDVRSVEIGGAAKNVLAIAVGIVDGCGFGESAKAALTARGFAELLRFAVAHGGRAETLMGLSGLGDVVLSCGSARSRNFALGHRIGSGHEPDGPGPLAEGAFTAEALVTLARRAGVEMPVAEAVAAVLGRRLTVAEVATALMTRPLRAE